MDINQKKIVFVGGKGGVGKSTSASALALSFANQNQKTLLVSTDPAHNIGDIFHKKLGHKKTIVSENLWALEIDPNKESKNYIQAVKQNLAGLVKSKMINEVNRQIDMASAAPGADEAALFDRIVSIVLEETKGFAKIVFDTAPTGHTIRLLSLPELMGAWMDGMLDRRKKINDNYSQLLHDGEPVEDPIYQVLQARKEKFAKVREILLDGNQCGFLFVLIPERLPILETEKAISGLKTHGLVVEALIVNKVLPERADGQFLQKRREQEKEYLKLIDRTFRLQRRIQVPLFEEDVADLEKLNTFSAELTKAIVGGEEE